MRAVLVGSVESSRVAIDAIGRAGGWSLPLVVSLPAELAHRHSDYVDLSDAARAAGATMAAAPDVNAPDICELVERTAPDYVFVIGWSQICRERFMAAAAGRMIGYHPAPLPRMRGRAVIPWTILNGEAITASTLFWIDGGVDSGPILEQRFFHVAADETAATLYRRHMEALAAMMDDALAALASGRARRQAQDERFATWAAKRSVRDGFIDWRLPARDVERLIRAVGRPYPGARTSGASADSELVIWQARIVNDGGAHLARPGQVIGRSGTGFVVQCGERSSIEVTEWENPAGRPPALHAQLGGPSC
jgi:methionyl-tRNA formyltransferase